jgi:enoyl-CoA hydratase
MVLSAARAEHFGFVNAVVPDAGSVLAAAGVAAEKIAARAPLAIAGSKDSLLYARDHSVAQSLERAAWVQAAIWNTAEIKSAITARMEKSLPNFENLPPLPFSRS